MSTDFLHGVEVVEVTSGTRPIQTVRSSVIGLVGTAPGADTTAFPLDTPVLISSRGDFSKIGTTGTLPDALNGIYDQFGATVVVVRVDEGASQEDAAKAVIGDQPSMKGLWAFRQAESLLGVAPMILLAPGFTGTRPNGVTAVALATPGAGYETAPTVEFTGGGNDPDLILPTAHAVLGTGAQAGEVTAIVIDSPGANMTAAPTADLTGGNPTTAATLGAVTLAAGPNPVVNAMLALAQRLRAHCIVDGPNTTDADAITYRGDWGDRRIYLVDPGVQVWDATTSAYDAEPASPRVAGRIARTDYEVGFWASPSNSEILNIGGLGRPVDWAMGDPNSRANLLNSNQVATFIRDGGWLLWGNRTCSTDATWAFLSVSRTADMIDISIAKASRWAVDKGITKSFFDDVVAQVNAYLRQLKAQGAILGGTCWYDPDLNQAADISAGHATFSYDFTPPTPAERVTFQSTITDSYISSIFSK